MAVEQLIDDLIDAGWEVLDSDFDPVAFQRWRRKALDCLTALVGPEHVYTQFFGDYVRSAETKDVMAGEGILAAAKEQLPTSGFELRDKEMTGQTRTV